MIASIALFFNEYGIAHFISVCFKKFHIGINLLIFILKIESVPCKSTANRAFGFRIPNCYDFISGQGLTPQQHCEKSQFYIYNFIKTIILRKQYL